MLVIRLLRVGKKNQPAFKIVVTDKRKPPRAGRFAEEVGFYNPLTKEKVLKAERIKYWISKGAKPSDTIHNLLVQEKIVEGKKIPSHKKGKTETKPTVVEGIQSVPPTAEAQPIQPAESAQPPEQPKPAEPVKEKPMTEQPSVPEPPKEEKPAAEQQSAAETAAEPPKEEKTENAPLQTSAETENKTEEQK